VPPDAAAQRGTGRPRGRAGAEHATLYDDVDDLDDAVAQTWRDRVVRLLDDLSEHMYKEDFGLFPAALATLDGADLDAVDAWEAARVPFTR
jgi:hemerythrin-like domain-containing protein